MKNMDEFLTTAQSSTVNKLGEYKASASLAMVLCYVRPWNIEQFTKLAEAAFPDAVVTQSSEHKSVDASGLSRSYYKNLGNIRGKSIADHRELSVADIDDIIARCRLLRKLSRHIAEKHLLAMAGAVREMLQKYQPQAVLSLTVDSNVIDLIRYFCGLMGIRFVGLVPSFVNGFFRITARGERTTNPLPDLNAVEAIKKNVLDIHYAPAFTAKSVANPTRGVLKRWASNAARFPYFWIKRFTSGDPYNFHYWQSMVLSAEHLRIFWPKEPGREDWERVLASDDRPPLYIPLQMVPECTIDYWSNDVRVIDYYGTLERLVEKHHRAFHILIKEHPAVMGYRPRAFYRKLRNDSRVTVVPTYTPSNYVLDKVPAVLVWTGTVGYEAALRGKAVITLCDPYYAQGKRFLKITPKTGSDVLLSYVLTNANNEVTREEQERLVRFLVGQLFKGSFKNDGSWSATNPMDVMNANTMALSLRTHNEAAQRVAPANLDSRISGLSAP